MVLVDLHVGVPVVRLDVVVRRTAHPAGGQLERGNSSTCSSNENVYNDRNTNSNNRPA